MISQENLKMPISFIKTSLIDFHDKLSSVIFFPFCNLRCPWCHNGALLSGKTQLNYTLKDAINLIQKRKNLINGVVLSGGEALLFSEIAQLISHIKKLPLAVKLDTNGTNPHLLRALLQNKESSPDFIALDLKFAPDRYVEIGAPQGMFETLRETIEIIRENKIPAEFRTVVLPPEKFSKNDIYELSRLLSEEEKHHWIFRAFQSGHCLDIAWNAYPSVSQSHVEEMRNHVLSESSRPMSFSHSAVIPAKEGIYRGVSPQRN